MTTPRDRLERFGPVYARVAIGAAFLSAVASRLGIWDGEPGLSRFAGFIQYTAEVNAFMPAVTIPFLAWAATVAETSLGVALIAGLQVRWAALASAALLALFGTAMAISLGPKSPLDYSVFSASGGALLLALHEWRTPGDRRDLRRLRRAWGALPRLQRERRVAAPIIGLY
ncbi:MAG TPA: DoxX family membrane protein [Gemmatimonadales bacterium]|nr:DoxX family membrane protein [Gemmatimonadales bacterium]